MVITKKHYLSNSFALPNDILSNLIIASKKVAEIIEKDLKPKRIFLVIEGMEINHIHIKLYQNIKLRGSCPKKLDYVYDEKYRVILQPYMSKGFVKELN